MLIPDMLFRQADLRPDKEAVRDSTGAVTYGELAAGVGRLSRGLRHIGLYRHARAIIALPNSIDFIKCHFAVLAVGAISVPCEPAIAPNRFVKVARSCEAQLLIATSETIQRLGLVLPDTRITTIVSPDHSSNSAGCATPIWSIAELSSGPSLARIEDSQPDDIACVLYTTGATEEPKGVSLKHSNVLAAIDQITEFVGYTEADKEVVVLPMSHSFGLGHMYSNFYVGGSIYVDTGLTRVKRVLDAIEGLQATGFPGTPLSYSLLLDHYASVLPQKLRSLRFIVIDSAPLSPERTEQIQALLPWVNIMVYYGLTEASRSTFISLTKSGRPYFTSVGRPMKNVRLKVIRDDGRDAMLNEDGEVCIQGSTVSPGYWNAPDKTTEQFQDGWLHTGDTGHVDQDGYLFLTGRKGDTINVGGLKVNPLEVEEVLRSFPSIRDAAVIGATDYKISSEIVIGVVVPVDAKTFVSSDCQRFCLERLETYKAPSKVVVVESIPRSSTGKLLRSALRDQIIGSLDQTSC